MSEQQKYDAIVLGAGPAGLSAGIYLSRAKKRVAILDTGIAGGAPILTHAVANYPGVKEVPGYELAFSMKEQAVSFGCTVLDNVEIRSMTLLDADKQVEADGVLYMAPTIIIATGGVPRKLGVPGEEKFNARGISYCATCDGDFFTGKDIAVVGGGNSALEEAVSLTAYASSVTILHEFDHFQAFKSAVAEAEANKKISFVMDCTVVEFVGDDMLSAVRIIENKSGKERLIPVAGAFIFIGYVPNSAPFSELQLSDNGEIITDELMKTGIDGVFAAGDVRQKRYRQITTAVSDGTIAALSALEYLEHR